MLCWNQRAGMGCMEGEAGAVDDVEELIAGDCTVG